MKITGIELPDFINFKNDFNLDLTYPAGHDKAGKPLDKICIIGQSGTGKTILLNLLRHYIINDIIDYDYPFIKYLNNNIKITFWEDETRIIKTIDNENKVKITGDKTNLGEAAILAIYTGHFQKEDKILFYYPFDVISKWRSKKTIEEEPSDVLKQMDTEKGSIRARVKTKYKNICDFDIEPIHEYFKPMEELIRNYSAQRKELMVKSYAEIIDGLSTLENSKEVFLRYENENKNPLVELAVNYLNPLLNNFFLEVKTDSEYSDNDFIKIKQLNGTEIGFDNLSSGTKHIILTTFPLYIFKPNETIIIFDEPESSLYPDMQVKHLENLITFAPDSQIIIATHSPTIASLFEPWEVVYLDFDESGKVHRKLFYDPEKDNRIENYNIHPDYLKYDEILRKVFKVEYEANYDTRARALTELGNIKGKLDKLKNQKLQKSSEYENLKNQLMNISEKLNWNVGK